MKVGYQDAGSWTILKDSVEGEHRKAAWLWAQFCVSKTVDLKKFMEGMDIVLPNAMAHPYKIPMYQFAHIQAKAKERVSNLRDEVQNAYEIRAAQLQAELEALSSSPEKEEPASKSE